MNGLKKRAAGGQGVGPVAEVSAPELEAEEWAGVARDLLALELETLDLDWMWVNVSFQHYSIFGTEVCVRNSQEVGAEACARGDSGLYAPFR